MILYELYIDAIILTTVWKLMVSNCCANKEAPHLCMVQVNLLLNMVWFCHNNLCLEIWQLRCTKLTITLASGRFAFIFNACANFQFMYDVFCRKCFMLCFIFCRIQMKVWDHFRDMDTTTRICLLVALLSKHRQDTLRLLLQLQAWVAIGSVLYYSE